MRSAGLRTWIANDGSGRKADVNRPRLLLQNHSKAGGCIRLWPDDLVTYGKSLLAQQLMTACAIGSRWLGLPTMRCPAYGIFCEDAADEILLRQRDINNELGIGFADLADMQIWSLLGEDALLMTFDRQGRGELTTLWHELRQRVLDFGARLLVVETAADVFGGNEILRSQVRHFIRACLGRLALDMDGAVLLCAHPSRSGLATGEGDGGSTAWSNSVRSRLFFARPDGDGADAANPDARVLTRKKANYAARGDEIRLTWRTGVFVPEGEPAEGVLASIEKRNAETAFLDALDRATAVGRNLSDSKNAGNYARASWCRCPPATASRSAISSAR